MVASDPDWRKGMGCLIWVGMTVVTAALTAAGVVPKGFLEASPFVLGPPAFAIAAAIYFSRRDDAEQEYVAAIRLAEERRAERTAIEASYTAQMEQVLADDR
jgi:hypothetical protein